MFADDQSTVARPGVVLLGASNLTRGLSTVIRVARLAAGEPCDIFLALGHGRSYGVTSWLLGRELPGILECGLWEALDRAANAPLHALITDVGNDIGYGHTPEMIAMWLRECVERLQRQKACIVMTALPAAASLVSLTPARFNFFRTIFFPKSRLTLDEAMQRVRGLDELMRQLAEEKGVILIEQRPDWYWIDPIHITVRQWAKAWPDVMRPWCDAGTAKREVDLATRPDPLFWISTRFIVPQQRKILGITQRGRQPARTLPDGTKIRAY